MAKTKKHDTERISAAESIEGRLEDCNEAYTKGAFKYLRLLLHTLGVGQFIYALYFWCNYVNIPITNVNETDRHRIDWGGKLKFLTFLNLILQAIYHSVALLNDLFGSNAIDPQNNPILRKLKDQLFTVLAFPIAHNVCVSFWVVYAFDRELIFPSALDAFFPNWLNHVVHTNIAMLIILDMFTCFRRYPKRSVGLASILFIMFVYLGWLHIVRYYSGRWAYPLFDVLNWPLRYFMLFGIAFVSAIFYIVGEFINNIIWEPELKLLTQKEKLKNL